MKFKLNQLLLGWSYVQTDTATTSNVESCCVRLHVAKRFTFFKLCATTPNNTTQQRATSCNRVCFVCKRTQHVTSNDVRTPRAKSDATLLDITCCVLFHTLLHVVVTFWELLNPFVHLCNTDANNTQHCWHNIVGICCVRLHDACLTRKTETVGSFRVQRFSFNNWDWCCTTVRILRSFYSFLFLCWKETINFSVWQYKEENDKHILKSKACPWKRTQHCWLTTPNIVGCYMLCPFTGICCAKFETDSNIVGPTMLGVVAPVCT